MVKIKKKVKYQVKKKTKIAEIEKKKELTLEEKFYWVRVGVAAISAIFGVLVFKIVGWWMLLYLVLFMLGWPFIQSFLVFRLPYKKGKWDWKQILKTGVGAHFFIFMLLSTVLFTVQTYPEWGDRLSNPADTNDIQISGDFAFVADGKNGMLILNNSYSNNRNLLNKFDLNQMYADRIYYSNSTVFLHSRDSGLYIIDVNDKSNPVLLSSINFSSVVEEIYIEENFLFLTLGYDGFSIYDIQDLEHPNLLSNYNKTNNYFDGLEFDNNIVFLSLVDSGLEILNVTDKSTPEKISSLELNGHNYAIKQNEEMIYVASGESGLQVVNVSNILSPNLISNFTTVNSTDIEIYDGKAFLANGINGIAIIDISNPLNLKNSSLTGNTSIYYNTIGTVESMSLHDNYLLIADGLKGISIINLDDPAEPITDEQAASAKTISLGWNAIIYSTLTVLVLTQVFTKKIKKIH